MVLLEFLLEISIFTSIEIYKDEDKIYRVIGYLKGNVIFTGENTYTLENALKDLVVRSKDYFNPQQRATLKEAFDIDLNMEAK